MYRRVAIERKRAEQGGDKPVTFQGAGFQYADGLNRPTRGVNDGNGFLFISHIGEIQPSGFLPVTAGNVRTDDVVDVYRHSQLFTDLRTPDKIKAISTHVHATAMATMSIGIGALALAVTFLRKLSLALIGLTGMALAIDIGAWWLAPTWPAAVNLIIGAGAVYNLGTGALLVLIFLSTWLPREKA